MIKKIKYDEVNWEKYEQCLENSQQKKYSAKKEFLNAVCNKNWDVLVHGDYQAVMPVPFTYKLGLKIVLNPLLTQQLGVFSKKDDAEINEKFLIFFKKKYLIKYYAFNDGNQFKSKLTARNNFLFTPNSYENIYENYSPKRKRKLKQNPDIKEFTIIQENLSFYSSKEFILKNMVGIETQKNKNKFLDILREFYENGNLELFGFFFKEKLINLIAIYQEKYTTALLGTFNNREFIKYNGASILIDFSIQKNVEHKIFDFEGGDLPNMNEYFRGFGAELKPYPCIIQSKFQMIKQIFIKN